MNRSWSFYQKIIDLVQLWVGLLPQTHQHLALKVPTSNSFSASPNAQVRHVLPPLRHRLQGLQVPAREGGVRRHEGGVPRQEGTCSEWTSWSLDSSHRPFLGEIEWGVIPKASAPSLWTVWTHWILSFVTYRLTYDWTNQFQTFWACCGMTRDCPQPKKNCICWLCHWVSFDGQPCIFCRRPLHSYCVTRLWGYFTILVTLLINFGGEFY